MRGFQLWLNLPARAKMTEPKYQEFGPDRIPVATPAPGVSVKVIAGEVGTVKGPIEQPATDPTYLDVGLSAGTTYTHALPGQHAAFVYVFEGAVQIGANAVKAGELVVLSEGSEVHLSASEDSRAILVAGRPLNEPVARYGPFVMNTREQLLQAVEDFQTGKF
jgi:quercetin 2,3-dioxygenase